MACGTVAALAGGLGTLAGTGLQLDANSREQNAMNNTVQAALNRNQQFVNQAQPVFNQSLNNSTPGSAQKQMQQGAQQVQQLTGAAALPSATLSLPQNDLPENAGNNASSSAQAARNSLSNQANANLVGMSNYPLQQALSNMATNRQLGLISNEAQNWMNILPTQLQAAAQSQTGLSDLGSLISALGGMGMSASMGSMGNQNFINQVSDAYTTNTLNQVGQLGYNPFAVPGYYDTTQSLGTLS